MSEVGDAFDEVRAELAEVAADILPDVCSFSSPGSESRDSHGEVSTANSALTGLEDVPCAYSALSSYERLVGGTVTQIATHKLRLPANNYTLGIGGTAEGVIQARGASPALNFQVTGRLDNSTSVFLELAIVMR